MKNAFIIGVLLLVCNGKSFHDKPFWGFYGHRLINRLAVFSLPPEMIIFYKPHIDFLSDHAVDPDKRRYAMVDEGSRHYIDLDRFPADSLAFIPKYWPQAIAKYTEDTLMARGIVPWHVVQMKYRLTKAFETKNLKKILKISAELGHYIGDANVPLHTTSNYNGQFTNQHGIHGFWESRIPEISADNYNLFVGKASYLTNPSTAIWKAVFAANRAVDSVLSFEKVLNNSISADKKYSFEARNGVTSRVYSKFYSLKFEKRLNGQVERQLKLSIKMVADFWYTCWVDAGQPDLSSLVSSDELEALKEDIKNASLRWQEKKFTGRKHEF